MNSNKKRLYVALYPSGVRNNDERKYLWGFLVGPKSENTLPVNGRRYQIRAVSSMAGSPSEWVYESGDVPDVTNVPKLLGRILIAKVQDEERLEEIFESTRVVQGDPDWRCRTWVAHVLSKLAADGDAVGTSQLDWTTIEYSARKYVANKATAGRYKTRTAGPKPTYDLLERREIYK